MRAEARLRRPIQLRIQAAQERQVRGSNPRCGRNGVVERTGKGAPRIEPLPQDGAGALRSGLKVVASVAYMRGDVLKKRIKF